MKKFKILCAGFVIYLLFPALFLLSMYGQTFSFTIRLNVILTAICFTVIPALMGYYFPKCIHESNELELPRKRK